MNFPEPVEAQFQGGDFDGLEIPMTHAHDRVRIAVTERGVEVQPILAPAGWAPSTPGYYLRIQHEPPLRYLHFEATDLK